MTTSDPVEFVLYDTNLTTRLAILPAAQGHIYMEFQEPGSGEVRIPLDSASADLVSNGQFVMCNYRGSARFGFFVDNIKQTEADQEEGGGRWVSISGRGPLAILDDAVVWDNGSGASTRAFTGQTKGYIFKTLLDEAQARGALSQVSYTFGSTVDSTGVDWTDSEDYDLTVGMSLLEVMRMFAQTGDMEFAVTLQSSTDAIQLNAYKNGTGTDRSDSVFMRIGSNCEEVSTDERGDEIKNATLIKYKDGYAKVTDAASIAARRRRESFLSLEAAQSSGSATTYATAKLTDTKDPKTGISVRVYDGIPPYLFVGYNIGDTVTIDKFGAETSKKILGIQADFDGDSWANVVLELNTIFYDNELRMKSKLDWLLNQWNTAKDDNLTEVKQWLSIGSPNGEVYVLHYYNGYLYVGGDFTAIQGSITTTNIAAYNVTTGAWSAMDAGITSGAVNSITEHGGEIYAAAARPGGGMNVYQYTGGAWVLIGYGTTSSINAMKSFGGRLYVGGSISGAGFSSITWSVVAYWTGGAWVSSLTHTTHPYDCLALEEYNGDLYAGFDTGFSGGLKHLAGPWADVMASPTGGHCDVNAITVAGSYLVYSGYGTFANHVFRWDGVSSTSEEIFESVTNSTNDGSLTSYLSDVYFGIRFDTINGDNIYGSIVKYSGGIFNNLNGGVSQGSGDNIFAAEAVGSDIYIGGKFSTVGGKSISNLAVWVTSFESLVTHLANGGGYDLAAGIHNATAITTPTNNDEFPLWEDTSQDLRKVTWANIKATLKTYFDALYGLLAAANTWTRQQSVMPPTEGALYLETHGDNYTLDMTQKSDTEEVTTTTVNIYRQANTNNITGNMIEAFLSEINGGVISGGLIHFEEDGTGTILFDVLRDGSIRLPQISDTDSANDSLYYSTTQSKLSYKDSGGSVHALW